MNGSADDISLVIFALLAVFVIWKLRSVLGTRTGSEPRPPEQPFGSPGAKPDPLRRFPTMQPPPASPLTPGAPTGANAEPDKVAPDRWKTFAEPGTRLWQGFDAIAAANPGFDPAGFLRGAAIAYEMAVTAYAKGDRGTLGNLLSAEVYESFDKALSASEARGETRETTIVSLEPQAFEDAHLTDGVAQLTVRFVSKLISVTRDRNGNVVEGSPETIADHSDDWTFARKVDSRDPNWKLVATHAHT